MLACHASAFTYTFRKEVSTRAYLPALPNQRLDTSRCAGCSDFLRTQSNTKADAVNAVAALHHAERTRAWKGYPLELICQFSQDSNLTRTVVKVVPPLYALKATQRRLSIAGHCASAQQAVTALHCRPLRLSCGS